MYSDRIIDAWIFFDVYIVSGLAILSYDKEFGVCFLRHLLGGSQHLLEIKMLHHTYFDDKSLRNKSYVIKGKMEFYKYPFPE